MVNSRQLKQKIDENAVGIALVALLVLGVGATQTDIPIVSGDITSQSCVTGISNTQIGQGGEDLDFKEYFKAEIVSPCSDQLLTGGVEIQPDQLESSKDGDNVKPERTFDVAFQNFEASAVQKIDERAANTITVPEFREDAAGSRIECGRLGCDNEAHRKCDDFQSKAQVSDPELMQRAESGDAISGFELACSRPAKIAEYTEFKFSTTTDFQSDVVLDVKGEGSDRVTISDTSGTKVLESGGKKAKVQWTGNLQGQIFDVNFPADNYFAVCDNRCKQGDVSGTWGITTREAIDGYKTAKSDFASSFDWATTYPDQSPTLDELKKDVVINKDVLMSPDDGKLENDIGYWVNDVEWRDDGLHIIPENPGDLVISSFTFRIQSDWLGIIAPVARPEVQNPGSISMEAQTSTSFGVDVLNKDTENSDTGTIQVTTSCPAPLQGNSDKLYNVEPGQTQTAQLTIDSGNSPTTSYSCDIIASDMERPQETRHTAQLTVDVETSCPDSDGDGVCDDDTDQCPNTPGPETNNGCAQEETDCDDGYDNDGDGLTDGEDPDCDRPRQDSDGDGVIDVNDECPNTPDGVPVNANGCAVDKPEDEYPNGCSDNVDNDGDNLIDERDPDCGGGEEPLPIGAIIGGILVLVSLGGLYYFRKPLIRELRRFGA